LGTSYEEDTYVTVSTSDYQREVSLWHELRYSHRGFATLPQQEGVNRVMTNGEFDLYYVNGTSRSASA
jgi:hypothetical protein